MTHVDLSPGRYTSVTIRSSARISLKKASALLISKGLPFSEQRLMRECLRLALKFWRGRKGIACRNKRYNKRRGPFEIVPFYTTEALRSVCQIRCHHAGISLSRLMDFAVRYYLERVMEYWLRFDYFFRDKEDARLWQEKYAKRLRCEDFIISYKAETQENNGRALVFSEKSEILPWPPPRPATA